MPRKKIHQSELSENGFRALIQNALEGIVLYDKEGQIKFASASVKKIAGYNDRELIGRSGADFIHPEDLEQATRLFNDLLKKPGKSIVFFQRIRHKKGHYFWSESSLTNFMETPDIRGIVSNFRDISEKHAAEENARQSKELLETINRNVDEGIFMGVLGKKFLYVNDAFLKITGYRRDDIDTINPSSLYADKAHHKKIINELAAKGSMTGVDTLFYKKNGSVFRGLINVSLLKHEGKKEHFVGTLRDVTREKQVESDLIESRNFLKNIINTVAAPIFVKDEKHRLVMMNEGFTSLIDLPESKMLGKTDRSFIKRDEAEIFWKIDAKVLKTGKAVFNEEKITSKSNSVHHLLTVKTRFVNEQGQKFVIGFITDLTPLRQVEEQIKQANANLQGVLESTKESVYALDSSLRYLTFNQNHKLIMKLLYDADIKTGDYKFPLFKGHEDGKWVKAEVKKALAGNVFISEHFIKYSKWSGYIQTTYNPIRDEKNNIKGVAVFVKDVTERKKFEQIIQSINSNLRAVLESTADRILALDPNFRYLTFNKAHAETIKRVYGREIKVGDDFLKVIPPKLVVPARTEIRRALEGKQFSIETELQNSSIIETTFNPIFTDDHKVQGAALFIRDITNKKRIEEKMKLLNEELVSQNHQLAAQEEELKSTLEELSERNFELDQLMYKTSHDLRSPLSSIMGLVNLATVDKDTLSRDSYIEKIGGRIKKLDEFIRSMLNYARVNRVEPSPEMTDLNLIAINCVKELEHLENFNSLKVNIRLKDGSQFKSDPLLLKIIFGNLISNAYKYYNPETNSYLTITIDVHQNLARITFKDNGIGIKAEHLDKVFNMFYRATDRSQGSGLGMYIVKQAVEKLGGTINVTSEYAKGTQIKVVLPAAK